MIELYNIISLNEQYKDYLNKLGTDIHEAKISELLFGDSRVLERIKASTALLIPEEFLELFKLRLIELFNKENVRSCFDIINGYIDDHKFYIRKHFRERWLAYNPNLKGRIFKYIDSSEDLDIWYFFGLLCADGYVLTDGKNTYTIALVLKSEDKNIIYKFSKFLGFLDTKVRPIEIDGDDGVIYHYHRLSFNCRSMVEDLSNIGIFSSKSERKIIPIVVKNLKDKAKLESEFFSLPNIWVSPSGKKALSWLRGFYDGDGLKGTTGIVSENEEYLIEIKNLFGTLYDPFLPNKSSVYHLYLGSIRFNNMLDAYKGGLKRVSRIKFNEDQERLLIIKNTLYGLNIPIDRLKLFFSFYTQTELTDLFKCSTYSVNKMSIDLGINGAFSRGIHRQKAKPKEVEELYNYIEYYINGSLKEYGLIF